MSKLALLRNSFLFAVLFLESCSLYTGHKMEQVNAEQKLVNSPYCSWLPEEAGKIVGAAAKRVNPTQLEVHIAYISPCNTPDQISPADNIREEKAPFFSLVFYEKSNIGFNPMHFGKFAHDEYKVAQKEALSVNFQVNLYNRLKFHLIHMKVSCDNFLECRDNTGVDPYPVADILKTPVAQRMYPFAPIPNSLDLISPVTDVAFGGNIIGGGIESENQLNIPYNDEDLNFGGTPGTFAPAHTIGVAKAHPSESFLSSKSIDFHLATEAQGQLLASRTNQVGNEEEVEETYRALDVTSIQDPVSKRMYDLVSFLIDFQDDKKYYIGVGSPTGLAAAYNQDYSLKQLVFIPQEGEKDTMFTVKDFMQECVVDPTVDPIETQLDKCADKI